MTVNQAMSLTLKRQLIKDELINDPSSARGKLLTEAAKLFRQKGYDKTTVRDLAAALGIQSGSLFHHYKSKEAILHAVMRDTVIYTTAKLKQAAEPEQQTRGKLLALIESELDSINGDTGEAMAVLVFEWRGLSEESQRAILKLRQEYEQLWLDTLSQAKQEGLIRTDAALTRRLLTGALSWSQNWYDSEGDMSMRALAEEVLTMISANG
ncbi:TetR/AcrR family transcriptional regulator [Sinobacterium caligoides]|nr:TetR/AcrR family transcriptional regulator [Sinobacterium caligoides]